MGAQGRNGLRRSRSQPAVYNKALPDEAQGNIGYMVLGRRPRKRQPSVSAFSREGSWDATERLAGTCQHKSWNTTASGTSSPLAGSIRRKICIADIGSPQASRSAGFAATAEGAEEDAVALKLANLPRRDRHCCMRLLDDGVPRMSIYHTTFQSTFPSTWRESGLERTLSRPSTGTRPGSGSMPATDLNASGSLAGQGRGARPPPLSVSPLSQGGSAIVSAPGSPMRSRVNDSARKVLSTPVKGQEPRGGVLPAQTTLEFDQEGHILADVLATCRVTLLKVVYLRMLAKEKKRLPRCQDVPQEDEGFYDLRARMAVRGEALRRYVTHADVYVVSHPWLSVEHPDPAGSRLEELVEELDYLRAKDNDLVFIDYCSLPQVDQLDKEYRQSILQGQPLASDHRALRTPEEEADFRRAISQMDVIYSSMTSKVLIFPSVHELSEDLDPVYTKKRPRYRFRGWCCFEYAIAHHFGRIVNDLPTKEFAKFDPFEFPDLVKGESINFGYPEDAEMLVQVYKRPYFTVKRAELIDAIRNSRAEQCREGIYVVLYAFNPTARREIVKELGDATCSTFIDDVAPRLRDPCSLVRLEACRSITKMNVDGQYNMDAIIAMLEDPEPKVRAAICDIVVGMGKAGDKHREAVAARLSDEAWDVREAALCALSKMGDALQIYANNIAERLDDPMAVTRATALACLLKMGPVGAQHADKVVGLAIRDQFTFVKHAAVVTLQRLGREDLLEGVPGYEPRRDDD